MINWLVQSMADLPALPAEVWLSPPERERLATLRVDKRRREWLLGRWTAKRLSQATLLRQGYGSIALDKLVVTPAPDGAPQLLVDLHPSSFILHPSISHSGAYALCALGPASHALGADIETIAPRSVAFRQDFFTAGELALVEASPAELRDTLVTAVWSAKEAALKALRRGLTVDTRLVECLVPPPAAAPGPAGWTPFTASLQKSLGAAPATLRCWWRRQGAMLLTIAASA